MREKVGVWILGALGNDSTFVIVGVEAIRAGLTQRIGLVTDLEDFSFLNLVELDDLVFGGYDIRKGSIIASAEQYARRNGILSNEILGEIRGRLREIDREIRPGISMESDVAINAMASHGTKGKGESLRTLVRIVQDDLNDFQARHNLTRIVVVNLASTEAVLEPPRQYRSLATFEELLDSDRKDLVPPSVLYAYAALDAGCPHINFTASLGCSVVALEELSRNRGVPRMGKDGKTGETLLKSTLAPMLLARNLQILSWEGHNILGNRDGRVLDHAPNKKSKIRDKDVVSRLLGREVHSRVRIDYCPSLADWKTAWDFIHFEGFLGTKMRMHVLWEGNDSALAAPLVLDLVRLADLADRFGEGGAMRHASSFFKDPYSVDEIAFGSQFEMLRDYVRNVISSSPSAGIGCATKSTP